MHRITAAEIANYNADKYLRRKEMIERMKNEQPHLGPRLTFFHYIYDEKMPMKDAIEKIVSEFPSISVDNIIIWYKEEEIKKEVIQMKQDKLKQIKQKALEEHIPIIMDDTLQEIEKRMIKNKPSKILEIGTAVGYSAICFSDFLSDNGKIDTIERDEERVEEAKKNIKDMELEDKINIYVGDAVEILPTLNEKYDMIFIDAAKGKYPFFLAEALRMLAPNGTIFADNILYKGYVMSDYNKHKQRTAVRNIRENIAETTENPLLDTEILEVGDGLAITKMK